MKKQVYKINVKEADLDNFVHEINKQLDNATGTHYALQISIAGKKFGHPQFYKLLEELADLHSRKNHDYAQIEEPLSNLRQCEQVGISPWLGVVVRLMDKFDRLKQFAKKGELKVKDENIKDTLKDIAVYALLDIILLEEAEK